MNQFRIGLQHCNGKERNVRYIIILNQSQIIYATHIYVYIGGDKVISILLKCCLNWQIVKEKSSTTILKIRKSLETQKSYDYYS